MQAVLVSVEGSIADTRARHPLAGAVDYYKREELLKDVAVPDSVRCLRELAQKYKIVYLAARPAAAHAATEEWLRVKGFPPGPIALAATHEERLALAKRLKAEFDFIAGIGSGWLDNELHLEIGCLSILLREFEGNWDTVRKHLLGKEHTALQTAANLLAAWAKDITTPEPRRMDVMLASEDVLPAVQALHSARWGYLSAITGLDHPEVPARPAAPGDGPDRADTAEPDACGGTIEVLYHFCNGATVVTLRVHSPRQAARVPSICSVIPSAGFFEREMSEMLGVTVIDAPNTERLFLSDDWSVGEYPLRKDFI